MSTETNSTNSAPSTGVDGKTIAIISYFSLVGWIIAYVLFTSNRSRLAAFHLRQTLALMLCSVAIYILFFVLLFIISLLSFALWFVYIGLFILWVIGLVAAINGQEKPMPVIGQMAQNLFSGIK